MEVGDESSHVYVEYPCGPDQVDYCHACVYVGISGPVSYRDAELARIIINQGGVDPLAFGSSLLYKCKNMQQK
jgi:hypothetical protein